MGSGARQHQSHTECRFFASFTHVDVRVGLVTDDDVGRVDHGFRDIRVQVQGHRNRYMWAERAAQPREHGAVWICALGRRHGAVIGDIHSIDMARVVESGKNLRECLLEEGLIDGTGGFALGQHNRDRRPFTRGIHGVHESRNLLRQSRYRLVDFGP